MHRLQRAPLKELSLLAIALVLSLASGSVAEERTAPLGPLALVKSSVARVLEVAQSSPMGSDRRRTGIVAVSHELFDFNEISRRALGQHWKDLSPGERDEFVQLFTEVLDRAFVANVAGATSENVAFLGEAIDGPWAQVRSRITRTKGAAIAIDYRLHERTLRWTVYDVVSEHASLVSTYRSQLGAILRASSFEELLERMRTDGRRRRDPSAQALTVPDRFTAGLLLAVLTRQTSTRR